MLTLCLSSDLTPFWNAQDTFWSSAGSIRTENYGYTYPEFNGLDTSNPSAVQASIAAIVHELYSSMSRSPGRLTSKVGGVAQSKNSNLSTNPGHATNHPESTQASLSAALKTATAAPEGTIWEWTARVRVKLFELSSSFAVLLFLGAVPENPDEWHTSPSYVGAHHAFVNSAAEHCANCTAQQDCVTEGFVHLQDAIAERSGLGGFDPRSVTQYLTEHLHWRIQKASLYPIKDFRTSCC